MVSGTIHCPYCSELRKSSEVEVEKENESGDADKGTYRVKEMLCIGG